MVGWSDWQPGFTVTRNVGASVWRSGYKSLSESIGSFPVDPASAIATAEAFLEEDGTLTSYTDLGAIGFALTVDASGELATVSQGYTAGYFDWTTFVPSLTDDYGIPPGFGDDPLTVPIPPALVNADTISSGDTGLVQYESAISSFAGWQEVPDLIVECAYTTNGIDIYSAPATVPTRILWSATPIPSVGAVPALWEPWGHGAVLGDVIWDVPSLSSGGGFQFATPETTPDTSTLPGKVSIIMQESHQSGELSIPSVEVASGDCAYSFTVQFGFSFSTPFWPCLFRSPRWRYYTGLTPPGPTPPGTPQPPLRLGQRWDGLGPHGHARLRPVAGVSGRIGGKNQLI